MSEIVTKSLEEFLLLLIIFGVGYVFIKRAETTPVKMSSIPALAAIPDIIGRATEMGRPVHYSGMGSTSMKGLAGMAILSYTARLAAESDVPIFITVRQQRDLVFIDATLRQAYAAVGKEAQVSEETLIWTGGRTYSHRISLIGLIMRRRPAGNFQIGGFATEGLIAMGAGAAVGAVSVVGEPGAVSNYDYMSIWLIGFDYTMIGDELWASAAEASRDPVQLGVVEASDYAKIAMIAITIIGALLTAVGVL